MCPIDTNISKTGNSLTNKTPAQTAGKNIAASNSMMGNLSNFEKGQTFRGEVIDLRNKTAKIQLSDARVITAKLDQSVPLSIGQQAVFRVVEVSNTMLALKVLPIGNFDSAEATILKALEGASLPKTERNMEAVRELLVHQLSIDKNSLYQFLQYSVVFPKASFTTLALMLRHNIPLNEVNTEQFEQYRNSEHRILQQLDDLSKNIAQIFETSGSVEGQGKLVPLQQQILDLLLNETSSLPPQEIRKNLQQMLGKVDSNLEFLFQHQEILNAGEIVEAKEFTLPTAEQKTRFPLFSLDDPVSVFTNEERLHIVELLEKYIISDESRISILKGDASIRKLAESLLKGIEIAAFREKGEPSMLTLQSMALEGELPKAFSNAMVIDVLQKLQEEWSRDGSIGNYLPKLFREELKANLSFLNPLQQEELVNGSMRGHTLLSFMKQQLKGFSEAPALSFVANKALQEVVNHMFVERWTLTPKQIQQEGAINKLYQRLEQDFGVLKSLFAGHLDGTEAAVQNSSNKTGYLQENLQFMKTLNQIFPYVQLPLKFSGKEVHSELFVYTKKEDLRNKKDQISVLLHLDMEYLGALDVRLELRGKKVDATFYLEQKKDILMFSEHLYQLEEVLKEKGFSLFTKIQEKEKETDIVKDFISSDSKADTMKRYNFDIRA